MKLLDSTTINYILENDIQLNDEYFVTPDVEQEISIAELVWKKKVPKSIKNIFTMDSFDESKYIKNYFDVLNKYGGCSFFNMTGFGDISLISLSKTLLEQDKRVQKLPLSWFNDVLDIYTDDVGLSKRLKKEVGDKVKIHNSNQI